MSAEDGNGVAREGCSVRRARGVWLACLLACLPVLALSAWSVKIRVGLVGGDYSLWRGELMFRAGLALVMLAGGVALHWRLNGGSLRERASVARTAAELLSGLLGGGFLVTVLWAIARPSPLRELLLLDLFPLWVIVYVFWLVVVTPLAEEVFWRLGVYGGLRTVSRITPALLVQAGLFAASHWRIVGITWFLVLAIVAALLLEKTRGLTAPIAFHIGINATCVLLTLWWYA